MRFDAFLGGSYVSQAATADCEDTINWYWEKLPPGAPAPMALYPTPGVTTLSTTISGPGRAHLYANGRDFAVIGSTLVEIDAGGVQTSRGTVAADSHPATISYNGPNGHQLFITSGGNGYIFDTTANTLNAVAALAGLATQGAFIEGYFLALNGNTATMYWSALFDGTSWTTGTNYAQRSLAADPWRAFCVFNRFIYLLGEKTGEIWNVVGGTQVFAPISGTLLPFGILAPWSFSVVGDTLIWLASTSNGRPCVAAAQGYSPQVISTPAMEYALAGYNYQTAIGDCYGEHGHTFYLLHFDTAGITWAYDLTTQLWCKRGSWANGQWSAVRPRWHQLVFNEQHRMIDGQTGAVYTQSVTSNLDAAGNVIRRIRRAPGPFSELERIFFPELTLDVEPGLGNTVDPGSNPQVMLRLSNDAGKTWGPELWHDSGKLGEYGHRIHFHRMGSARRRVFEVVVTDPVAFRITGAYLRDVSVGS